MPLSLPFWLFFPKGIYVPTVGRVALLACLFLVCSQEHAQTPPKRKLFTSSEDGVTFSYPATWLLNADDDAATAKLRLADLAPAHVVIQLEGNFTGQGPYKDTDFDAGAFAYTIVPAESQAACLAIPDRLANQEATPTLLDHHPAREVRFATIVAGTEDIHHLAATENQNRCLVFETVLIRRSPDIVSHPLTPARWHLLENAFDVVLRSVRLGK